MMHNQKVYKSVPFNDGDNVRILEKKEKFDKGKQKFSKEWSFFLVRSASRSSRDCVVAR